MKWITHQAGALAAAVWFQVDTVTGVAMVGGAVLPDFAEQVICRGNQKLFWRIHRGILHWFGIYALLLAAAGLVPDPGVRMMLAGLALGAISHLLMDALNPTGVPLVPFRERPRLKYPLVSTGSAGEYGVLAVLAAVIVFGVYRLKPDWLSQIGRLW